MSVSGDRTATARARDVQRDRQLEYVNGHSTLPRLRVCGRVPRSAEPIPVYANGERAHFGNLTSCASVHSCPRCAPKIRNKRAQQIDALIERAAKAGHGVEFVTLTVPHDYGDRLDTLLAAVQACWNSIQRNRPGRDMKARYGLEGFVRALEINHGPNGWHPHLHIVWITQRPLTVTARAAFAAELFSAWSASAVRHGLRRPTVEHGVDVQPATPGAGGGLGRYMLGLELARLDLKVGTASSAHRSPFQILEDVVATGDVADQLRWREYEQATHGRRALTWSRGLKAAYEIVEVSDEEAADEEAPAAKIADVPNPLWVKLVRVRGFRAELKRIARDDGTDGVSDYLARMEAEYVGAYEIGRRSPPGARARDDDGQRLAFLRWLRMPEVERARRFALARLR